MKKTKGDQGTSKKNDDKWRIRSAKTGKLWPAQYDNYEDALKGMQAYHVHNK